MHVFNWLLVELAPMLVLVFGMFFYGYIIGYTKGKKHGVEEYKKHFNEKWFLSTRCAESYVKSYKGENEDG